MVNRKSVAALTISLSAFIAIITSEGYTEKAVVPTKNDRFTVGFGSTFRDDGTPVKPGDTIDPVSAVKRTRAHIAKDESGIRKCVTAPMSEEEFSILVDFAYQYGVVATCASSMVRHVNAGNYPAACNAYTLYKRSGGYDCSTLINGQPNRRCWGVWTRNLARRDKCLAAGGA